MLFRSDAASRARAEIEARINALSQLQAKLSRGANGGNMESWLAARGLDKAPRFWQGIEIASGWEDALEAVLRERLNAAVPDQVALDSRDSAADWLTQPPPGKLTVVDTLAPPAGAPEEVQGWEPLRRHVTCRDARLAAVVDDWLHGVYTTDRKSTRLNSSHIPLSRMPSSA